MNNRAVLPAILTILFSSQLALGQGPSNNDVVDTYGDARNPVVPRNVYWGDTHLHTNYSPDANLAGNASLDPAAAYRFARGETVTGMSGKPARLDRALDFLVVADHAEYLGLMPLIREGDERVVNTKWGAHLAEGLAKGGVDAGIAFFEFAEVGFQVGGDPALNREEFLRPPWERNNEMADAANTPGMFTAFIGFEWSSAPAGDNLHRVVIFRDDADKANQVMPFSAIDSDDPEDLWKYLTRYEESTGGKALAIPHNGNVSGGLMFTDRRANGEMLDESYARERARWEPLYEVTQNFGDGEAHPLLSPDDEFADFETWDNANLIGQNNNPEGKKTLEMLRHEYGREALKLGLRHQQNLGVNPFKYGFVGGTDMHTAMSTSDESNFWGKTSLHEPSPDRLEIPLIASKTNPDWTTWGWQMTASGYVGVWSVENSREALFDAMMRKETYATTGPRMTIRFFGGWDFTDSDIRHPDIAQVGYRKGVPMGGDLIGGDKDGRDGPAFLISVLKDPIGANLDRVQVIKGWVDANGKTHERIYDVAVSDGRIIDNDGRCKTPVGNTVVEEKASYENSIGAVQLTARWEDPDFDPELKVFYYVRAIEIPTPRWPAYDIKYLGAKPDPKYQLITQERAYTSAIWYTP
jgi:hypothetical protein